MRFPVRYFKMGARRFAEALSTRADTTVHFLRITRRVAIVWDLEGVQRDTRKTRISESDMRTAREAYAANLMERG